MWAAGWFKPRHLAEVKFSKPDSRRRATALDLHSCSPQQIGLQRQQRFGVVEVLDSGAPAYRCLTGNAGRRTRSSGDAIRFGQIDQQAIGDRAAGGDALGTASPSAEAAGVDHAVGPATTATPVAAGHRFCSDRARRPATDAAAHRRRQRQQRRRRLQPDTRLAS